MDLYNPEAETIRVRGPAIERSSRSSQRPGSPTNCAGLPASAAVVLVDLRRLYEGD